MAVFILWSASVISWDIWFVCRVKIGFVTIWIHYLHLADTVMNDVADIQKSKNFLEIMADAVLFGWEL